MDSVDMEKTSLPIIEPAEYIHISYVAEKNPKPDKILAISNWKLIELVLLIIWIIRLPFKDEISGIYIGHNGRLLVHSLNLNVFMCSTKFHFFNFYEIQIGLNMFLSHKKLPIFCSRVTFEKKVHIYIQSYIHLLNIICIYWEREEL